jgi:hypothetical protein
MPWEVFVRTHDAKRAIVVNPYQSPSSADESDKRTQRSGVPAGRHPGAFAIIFVFWWGASAISGILYRLFDPAICVGVEVTIIASLPFMLVAIAAYFLGVAAATGFRFTWIKWPRETKEHEI